MAEPNFEIPAQMREFIEKSVDQARSAYESFAGAAEKAVSSVEAVLPSGAKEVNDKVFAHSQANIEATFDFAKKLAHAKDAQEFMQLHSDFAKAQMETIQKQTSELGAAIQKAVTGTTGKSSGFS
ncbi:MAG: phasin [Methylocystis sp.]